ncbi:MSCRAMM family protein [Amycolatopsis sp. H20-H5]|uniref:MSCRAMM family protein n=1 Tax=Amycolatopsis sp. H20-H5 TaxID=3046309 RepID=UPI002DBE3880|nr:hypothetical protein [Amycolatopsis sp. H20-H5]MEC3981875.1 hypothetical protein [Amycolatopsis sp. H20-H5]
MGWSTRPRAGMRAITGLVATCLLGALSVTIATPAAHADPQQGIGFAIKPGQDMSSHTPTQNWLGSYLVNGHQVFCVSFQLTAPDSGEVYKPGDELKTKWGTPLEKDKAANISYLLLRYGDTKKPEEAAALAHLLHSWTSAPRAGNGPDGKPYDDLNKTLGPDKIGYDVDFHLTSLKAQDASAATAVDRLTKDAVANRGPWTSAVTPPKADQNLGTPAAWTFTVKNAAGKGMADVPVKLTATDGTIAAAKADTKAAGQAADPASAKKTDTTAKAEGKKEVTLTTGADGTIKVDLTPTGDAPKLVGSLSAPADKPYVQFPVRTGIQNVVSTGGEKALTAQGAVKVNKPGKVQVTKTDAKTGKGIAGAVLRVTAEDKTKPALSQDGKPLNGADGQPAVVTTAGETGVVTVENLRTPQKICVVEVNAPPGYTNAFDPKNPPSACGEVKPGETLALTVSNTPNEVPRTIPAGGTPTVMAQGVVETSVSTPGLLGLGVLALLGSALVGAAARRSSRR